MRTLNATAISAERSSFEIPHRHQRHLGVAPRPTRPAQGGEWFSELAPPQIFLSVVTVAEISKGIERVRHRGDKTAARNLDTWLATLVAEHSARILPIDPAVAECWGRFNVPNPIPVLDGFIAATAWVHGLTVATRNVTDFHATGVECFDPFS